MNESDKPLSYGNALILHGSTMRLKVRGLGMILRAQFDRSIEQARKNGYEAQHPNFDTYVRMRDFTGIAALDELDSRTTQELLQLFRSHFGPDIVPGMPVGVVCWSPSHET